MGGSKDNAFQNQLMPQQQAFQQNIMQNLEGSQGRSNQVFDAAFGGYGNLLKGLQAGEGIENQLPAAQLRGLADMEKLRTDRPGEANMYLQAGLANMRGPQRQQQGPPQPSTTDRMFGMAGVLDPMFAQMMANRGAQAPQASQAQNYTLPQGGIKRYSWGG